MKLRNEEYNHLDQAALQLRLDYNLLEDKLDIDKLAILMNISLIPYSSLKKEIQDFIHSKQEKIKDGFTITAKDINCSTKIFYNDKMSDGRIRFTICHELDHFIFEDKNDGEYEELRANHFARQLLIPTCLVMICLSENMDVYDIQSKFNVSFEVAVIAYNHATNRINRYSFALTDYEKDFLQIYYSKHFGINFSYNGFLKLKEGIKI